MSKSTCNGRTVYRYGGSDTIHREDGPAIIGPGIHEEWYYMGKHHREDGPAMIRPNGSKYWYQHGEFHRKDGPAIIGRLSTPTYYINGLKVIFGSFEYLAIKKLECKRIEDQLCLSQNE